MATKLPKPQNQGMTSRKSYTEKLDIKQVAYTAAKRVVTKKSKLVNETIDSMNSPQTYRALNTCNNSYWKGSAYSPPKKKMNDHDLSFTPEAGRFRSKM